MWTLFALYLHNHATRGCTPIWRQNFRVVTWKRSISADWVTVSTGREHLPCVAFYLPIDSNSKLNPRSLTRILKTKWKKIFFLMWDWCHCLFVGIISLFGYDDFQAVFWLVHIFQGAIRLAVDFLLCQYTENPTIESVGELNSLPERNYARSIACCFHSPTTVKASLHWFAQIVDSNEDNLDLSNTIFFTFPPFLLASPRF